MLPQRDLWTFLWTSGEGRPVIIQNCIVCYKTTTLVFHHPGISSPPFWKLCWPNSHGIDRAVLWDLHRTPGIESENSRAERTCRDQVAPRSHLRNEEAEVLREKKQVTYGQIFGLGRICGKKPIPDSFHDIKLPLYWNFQEQWRVSTHETINFTELQEGINKAYVTGLCYAAKLQSSLSVKFQSKYCRLCSKYCKLCHTSLLLQDWTLLLSHRSSPSVTYLICKHIGMAVVQ